MQHRWKLPVFVSALNEFAQAVALLGPWVVALALWPKAAAQNHAVIRTDVMKMAKASGAAAPDFVAIPAVSKASHPRVRLAAPLDTFVQVETEIHPPRALATSRLNHSALDSFSQDRVSAPDFKVPVTEADILVTGNGGMANDLCMTTAVIGDENTCQFGHGPTVLPVNTHYAFTRPNSLIAKSNQAWDAQTAGDCSDAARHYQVFIHEREVQGGKGVDPDAAAIMIAGAEYLIAHCP